MVDTLTKTKRIKPLLIEPPEISSDAADPGRLSGRLEIVNASFQYREDGPTVLNRVSLRADPGELIALVGPSGCGKSTILRLLLGFESPVEGTVVYDGQDVAGLDVLALRRQLGVVLQNGRVAAGSIMENIAGNAKISFDEAWESAADAGFADDVRAMPMEMHTIVSEGGGNLSGGQRQRLLVARALALRPKLILFDEATSALDNRTQKVVSDALDRRRVTRVVVAHRLSTIRGADRIYVLDAGNVVQIGDYDTLAAEPGIFRNMVERQTA
jgi:ATP-binding cassette subfamily C protein